MNVDRAKDISSLLKASGQTLSCAESCTGGNIAHSLTLIPGASEFFLGGLVSYSVEVKESVLGIQHELIEKRGVVSSEVAAAMASGVRNLTGSDFAVSTTGLAGPGGDGILASGTVWIATSGPDGTRTHLFETYSDDRSENIDAFTAQALMLLYEHINRLCCTCRQNRKL